MLNMFVKKSAEELYVDVELSDGRRMSLEDLVRDYERLLKNETSKKENFKKEVIPKVKDDKVITKKLRVGEWFRIDRNVIDENRNEIYRKCIEEGTAGKKLWVRFEKSNKIANQYPRQYPRLIETYIFEARGYYITQQKKRDMCKYVGDGMCDEIICDLELQMRICNGESLYDLIYKHDELPRTRVIKLRNGGTGYFGGGVDNHKNYPTADLRRYKFDPNYESCMNVPYAFRRVL